MLGDSLGARVFAHPKKLIAGQKWDFWVFMFVIGFVEVMVFIGSAPIGNVHWQVNIILSALYVVGIGLVGFSLFKGNKK